MRISDWSSDVCSSDLGSTPAVPPAGPMLGDGIPLPFLDEPPTVPASQVTAPAAPPAPVTSARRDPEPPGVQPPEADVPGVRPRDAVPDPHTADAAPPPPSAFPFIDHPALPRHPSPPQRARTRHL